MARITIQRQDEEGRSYFMITFSYDEAIIKRLRQFKGTFYSGKDRGWKVNAKFNSKESVIKRLHDLGNIKVLDPITISSGPKPEKKSRKLNSNPISSAVEEKLEEFEQYMQQKRYAYNTRKSYMSMARQFFAFHYEKDWKDITPEDIRTYNFQHYIQKDLSHSSQNQWINSIKLFYKLNKNEHLVPDEIERPRRQKRLPNVMTIEEVRKILMSCGNLKHKTLLCLVYSSGLRIGEALNLKLTDISRGEMLLYIRQSKGMKDRRVPLSKRMLKMLEEYYFAYKPKVYVFEGPKGGKYSHTSARKVFQRAVAKAGLSHKKVVLHTLRHSYATHLLEKNVGLRYIQDILGHKSPKTTMIYTHVSGKKLQEVKSPLDDMDI